MAEPVGRQAASLRALLLARPDRFDSLQALRVLQRVARDEMLTLRLSGNTSLSCPPGGIDHIELHPVARELVATLNHLTLAGANGPLPPPFSEEINARLRSGDTALRDFLDIFVDRLARLDFDRAQLLRPELGDVPADESASGLPLLAMLGMATPGMPAAARAADAPPSEAYLALAPLLHREPLSAHALQRAIAAWIGLPTSICQFRGSWLQLPQADRTRLQPRRGNNRLGRDATLGTAVWNPIAGITVVLGPMPLAQAEQLLPGGARCRALAALIDRAVDPMLEVALSLLLLPGTVPPARLGGGPAKAAPARLGWTSRLAGSADDRHRARRSGRIDLPPGWIAASVLQ
ncbi:type VI secretion system baseplate subunit TssG [Sphingomonas sp.]|uniref:type VI secretion system baseplate subunit TssG n=1 Tax=Sphingomonas sp. TaxID=28214 RepID=UPI0028AFF4A0|nr:type VI secretion system baseplate subunit TssG [Sphingomonas sp.]